MNSWMYACGFLLFAGMPISRADIVMDDHDFGLYRGGRGSPVRYRGPPADAFNSLDFVCLGGVVMLVAVFQAKHGASWKSRSQAAHRATSMDIFCELGIEPAADKSSAPGCDWGKVPLKKLLERSRNDASALRAEMLDGFDDEGVDKLFNKLNDLNESFDAHRVGNASIQKDSAKEVGCDVDSSQNS